MRKKLNFVDMLILALLLITMLVSLLPILNTIAISFSDKTSAATGKVVFFPVNFSIAAYEAMMRDSLFFRAFFNSFLRVLIGASINLSMIVLLAFPLSHDKSAFRGRGVYMWIVIFAMLFNGGLVPNFLLIKNLGLFDTIWALVLPQAVPIFSVLILMNYMRSLPKELEEAAWMDGANPLKTLVRVVLPISLPCLATVALLSVVHHWNTFFDGLIYINRPENMPLQSYIKALTVDPNLRYEYMTPEELQRQLELSNLTFNSAKIVVSMIPILLVYPFLQKYFVTGIVMGSVKG